MWLSASNCKTGGMSKINVGSNFKIYNKTGSGNYHYHDIGIVENKNDKTKYFIYVVFTKNQKNDSNRQEILKNIFNEFKNSIS